MDFCYKPSNSLNFCFPIITLILIFTTTINSTSFNFPDFPPNDPRIHYENDSTRVGNAIYLTKNSADDTNRDSVGRATYSQPIQVWDATTGRLADFDTHFSFIIAGLNETSYGDGLTFFLTRFESVTPPDSHGGHLGLLTDNGSAKNLKMNQFVAVEFDSYENPWDPSSDHVGININSVVSMATKSFGYGSIRDGRKANAWVSYNSTTKNLSVFLTYAKNPVFNGNSTLFYILDLSKILPERIRVGFSAGTGWGVETHKILSWQFNSTLELIEVKKDNKTGEGNNYQNIAPASTQGKDNKTDVGITDRNVATEITKEKGKKTGLLVGVVVSLGVLASGLSFALFIWLNKRRNRSRNSASSDAWMDDALFEKGSGPNRFTYKELVYATSNFDEGGKLGEGGFGGVYKGLLSGAPVAVKRISKGSQQGKKEYQSEVRIISQLRHRNLVQLIGWCHERNDLLLVYEFMPNRSLDNHLFRGENVLTWEVRYKIALGLASALLYLHEEWEQCVVHRDIKSSNVMLDTNFNAKLGDFGLARLVDHDLNCQTTVLAGTVGYLAPESIATGKSSKESDIYSFGIVALEIACGRKPIETIRGVLVEFVWDLYGRGNIVEAADERLQMEFNELEMEQLMVVGLWCAHPDSKSRPSATQVLNVLKFESPLPTLPLELPTAVYLPTAPAVPNFPSPAGHSDTFT